MGTHRTAHPKRISLIILSIAVVFSAGLWLGLNLSEQSQQIIIISSTPEPTSVSAIETTPDTQVVLVDESNGGYLRVHFIDVGQGDSIFIQTPDGSTALIDGGNGNGKALAYLQQVGITEINVMVASHPHADHIGGLVEVMQTLTVDEIWTSGASHTTFVYENFLDTITEQRIPYYEATVGASIPLGDLQFEVVYVNPNANNLNNGSVVLRLSFGAVSFLFTGDAEIQAERAMIQTASDNLQATVLKVGHHGSSTSSSPAFLAIVRPEIAVYSASATNSYGHPRPSTISNLINAGATIYGTNVQGTIVIVSDGQTYDAVPERDIQPIVGVEDINLQTPASVTVPSDNRVPQLTATFRYDPFGPDRDCGDFETHAEAQAFFEASGGGYGLDGDGDGIACENLP